MISPLLANVYLNELDWELAKANLEFVRYADDSIVMCKSKEELEKAKALVHDVLEKLGLELAEDKSDEIDFHNKDFSFLGFAFKHLRLSAKGNVYYTFGPSVKSIKKFKTDIKAKTRKTWTFSFEKWKEILNPILRGKYNYFLIPHKVMMELRPLFKARGRYMHGIPVIRFNELDGYVRQRLRVNFSCRGKKHGGQVQGKLLSPIYDNVFFIKTMGLTTGSFMLSQLYHPKSTIEDHVLYLSSKKRKRAWTEDRARFFKYAYAKRQ